MKILPLSICLGLGIAFAATAKNSAENAVPENHPAVLWRNPADLERRDLYYGQGGQQDQPKAPFHFIKEDLSGTHPKFLIRDSAGVKWTVKLGSEARPETAASRIVWAAGYFTDEDYFLGDLRVQGMPFRLHRGRKAVDPDGSVHNVRLKRSPGASKLGQWGWREGPFAGTRELNGLRALLALINDWDLKDENNSIRQEEDELVYVVSDLGATFGPAGVIWPLDSARDNFIGYERSKFIGRLTSGAVDFQAPARPRFVFLVNPKGYVKRVHLEWIGRNIPRVDAKWIGQILARLSDHQIREAFRAAGYSATEIDGFSRVLESRISALSDL